MTDIEHVTTQLDIVLTAIPTETAERAGYELGAAIYDVNELGPEHPSVEPIRAAAFAAMQCLGRARTHLENGYADIADYRALMVGSAGLHAAAGETQAAQTAEAGSDAAAHSGDVRHVRPEPAAWAETLAFVKGLINPGAPQVRTREMVDTLLARLGQLDNESLDELRYYGLGLIMCGIAQKLHDPKVREGLVRNGAEALFANWRSGGSTGRDSLQVEDVRTALVKDRLSSMVEDEAKQLSVEVELLNDALLVVSTQRESAINEPQADPKYNPTRQYHDKRGIIKHGVAAKFAGDNSLAGAGTSVRAILSKREEYMNSHNMPVPIPRPAHYGPDQPLPRTAVEVLESASEDDLGLVRIAQRLAALRRDEFAGHAQDYVAVDQNGRTVFLNKKVTPSRELLPSPVRADDPAVLHRKRLQCPAMFVEKPLSNTEGQDDTQPRRTPAPTERLIPTVVGLVVGMIRRADEKAREWERVKKDSRGYGY